MTRRLGALVLVSLLALAAPAAAGDAPAQSATTRSAETLRAEPQPAAADVGKVAANARVQVVERKGFWAKVTAASVSGWLKLSALSLDPVGTAAASSGPSLAALASGRTGSGNIVNTAGTRGLSAEDLRSAQPDLNAVAGVKAAAATPDAASRYAQDGGLKPRQVPYVNASGAPTK